MNPNKRKRAYLAAVLAGIVLTILITACKTITPAVEYIHVTPDVIFPVFPPPDCVTYDDDSDLVSMPLWYWQKIAEYKIDVDAIQEYLSQLRQLSKENQPENKIDDGANWGRSPMSELARQTAAKIKGE